jgi:hypothetical protein
VLKTSGDYWLHKRGLRRCDYLDFSPRDGLGQTGQADQSVLDNVPDKALDEVPAKEKTLGPA